ncbi:MAG: dipeptidase PepE [Planctomycetes bacterium]|nr:dipeptidase PepE [Planctomycetota bacterium]
MRLLLLSNSKKSGFGYLEWAKPTLQSFLGGRVRRALFVPYAIVTRSHDDYVELVRRPFRELGLEVEGLHRAAEPQAAVAAAELIVVGGGNTWQLARSLHLLGLMDPIRRAVRGGTPYVGWSAGSNVACPTFQTTNDMPIVDPLGFDALGLVPFQINPHYLHGNPPGFQGETREERIREYLEANPRATVVGLREGTLLRVEGDALELVGDEPARLFRHGSEACEVQPGGDLRALLGS